MNLSLKSLARDKLRLLPPFSVLEGVFGTSSVLLGTSLSLSDKLEELSDPSFMPGAYHIRCASLKCYEESTEWSESDEAYALFVTAGWGPENGYVPWVKIRKMTPMEVDVERDWKWYGWYVTKPKEYSIDPKVDLWATGSSYDKMSLSKQLVLVQAMEHDESDVNGIVRATEKVLRARLQTLVAADASRKEIIRKMKKQMKETIGETRHLQSGVFSDKFINYLYVKSLRIFCEGELFGSFDLDYWLDREDREVVDIVTKGADFYSEEARHAIDQHLEGTGLHYDEGGVKAKEDPELPWYIAIVVAGTAWLLEEIGDALCDDFVGDAKKLTIHSWDLNKACDKGSITKSLTFDGTADGEGIYKFKFEIHGKRQVQ